MEVEAIGCDRPASLRVLHVVTRNQSRGAESAARDLSQALAERGYRTRVVALAPTSGAGILDVPVLGRRPLGPRTLLLLRSEMRDVDVVVAHGSRTLPAVVLAGLGLPRRTVYQNIGDPLYWARGAWRRRRVRLLLGRVSAVAALSDQSASVLQDHFGVPAERLHTVRNARPGSRFKPPTPAERSAARAALGILAEQRVIVIIGALAPEKRVNLAIEATTRIEETVLIVAGDGPDRAALERKAGGRANIRFLGSVDDVVPILHASDVLLMTSASEGVPGALIEAGLCGVPAVTTDVGYVSDVVVHGETGLLVRSAAASDIGEAVQRALAERGRLGAQARTHCLERYELEAVVDSWEHLLDQGLTRRPHRPSS